jgi:hypothetical protein
VAAAAPGRPHAARYALNWAVTGARVGHHRGVARPAQPVQEACAWATTSTPARSRPCPTQYRAGPNDHGFDGRTCDRLASHTDRPPRLAAVLVGEDPASVSYVSMKPAQGGPVLAPEP